LAFPQNFNNGVRLSCQEAAFPFHTSSLVNRKVILRLSRFDLLCGPNASGISVRTIYGICLSGGERTELERCALECQNILRVDFTYIYCFECENIGTFKKGITLFFVFITILVAYHSRDGSVGWGSALQAGRSRFRFPMVSMEFFVDLIFPATLTQGSNDSPIDMNARDIFWRVKAASA
jgi:hypothetical protein